ncbi:MAG: hypothetical protein ACO1TE_23665 [Prosthecobacter sp.]
MHHPFSSASYRRSTEMAAEDMISEGAPLRQPSKADSEAALARARRHGFTRGWQHMITPTTAFWTGFATGLAVSLLERKLRHADMEGV